MKKQRISVWILALVFIIGIFSVGLGVFKKKKVIDLKRCENDLSGIVIPKEFANSIDKGYFIRFENEDYLIYKTQNNIERKIKMSKNYLLTDDNKKIQKENFSSGDIISIRIIETFVNVPEAAIIQNRCVR